MALGDEQIDRLTKNLDDVFQRRVQQIDVMLESRIEQFRETLSGITLAANVNLQMPDVKKAEPSG